MQGPGHRGAWPGAATALDGPKATVLGALFACRVSAKPTVALCDAETSHG
jgi:hypothetical protein